MSKNYHHLRHNRRSVRAAKQIDSMDVIHGFLREADDRFQSNQWLRNGRVTHTSEAKWILDVVNVPDNGYYSILAVQRGQTVPQQFTYVRSNLGVGYIFYFLCDGCDKRVKKLYLPEENYGGYRCRDCYRLRY